MGGEEPGRKEWDSGRHRSSVCTGEAGGRSNLGERTQHKIWRETNKVRGEGSVTLKQRDTPGTQ